MDDAWLLILDLITSLGLDAAEPAEFLAAISVLPPEYLDLFGGLSQTAQAQGVTVDAALALDVALAATSDVSQNELQWVRMRRRKPALPVLQGVTVEATLALRSACAAALRRGVALQGRAAAGVAGGARLQTAARVGSSAGLGLAVSATTESGSPYRENVARSARLIQQLAVWGELDEAA